VARAGWNGAGMFAYIVPASQYPAITGVAKEYWGEGTLYLIAHIGLLKLLKKT
jgi:hypothetical protein